MSYYWQDPAYAGASNRLNYLESDKYVQDESANYYKAYSPQLTKMMNMAVGNLNARGVYQSGATPQIRAEMTSDFMGQLNQFVMTNRNQGIRFNRELLAKLEEAEKARKAADKAGWMSAIGTVAGIVAPFFIPGGQGVAIANAARKVV